MNNIEIIKEWIKYAEMDRSTAEYENKRVDKPFEIICYHCQQSVEKYLKACLIMYGYSVYKSHDLFELLGYCIKENKEFEKIKEECISLTNYAVETRYPFHKFELEENDVKEAINSMNKCNNLIIDVLNNYLQNEKENNNKEAPIDEDNTEDDDEEEM